MGNSLDAAGLFLFGEGVALHIRGIMVVRSSLFLFGCLGHERVVDQPLLILGLWLFRRVARARFFTEGANVVGITTGHYALSFVLVAFVVVVDRRPVLIVTRHVNNQLITLNSELP